MSLGYWPARQVWVRGFICLINVRPATQLNEVFEKPCHTLSFGRCHGVGLSYRLIVGSWLHYLLVSGFVFSFPLSLSLSLSLFVQREMKTSC